VTALASAADAAGTGTVMPRDGSYMGAFGTTDNAVQVDPLGPFPAVAPVGPATRFNEARFSPVWPTNVPGIETHLDVYLDTGWQDGSGFAYSVAVSAAGTPIHHRRDFFFHVYKGVDANSDKLYVGFSCNTDYQPDDRLADIGFELDTSGWYRFDYDFNEVEESPTTQGYLEVTMELQPGGGGDFLFADDLSNPSDIIDSDGSGGVENRTVGGRNYGWFPYIQVADGTGSAMDLYVDSVKYTNPEPATLAMLALGGLALLRRRRG
jgi:hypothetical protein